MLGCAVFQHFGLGMRYRVLGPLEVCHHGRRLALGGPQQRTLLAVLLLNANQVVSVDTLVEALWDEEPPPDARRLLHGCLTRLRRALSGDDPRADGRQSLVTRPPGYLPEVRPGELDLDPFMELERATRQSS